MLIVLLLYIAVFIAGIRVGVLFLSEKLFNQNRINPTEFHSINSWEGIYDLCKERTLNDEDED